MSLVLGATLIKGLGTGKYLCSKFNAPLLSSVRQCIHPVMSQSFSNGQKILVNDANMYYEQVGSGNHVVVLIPGALGSIKTDFAKQMQKMDRDRFTLVGVDCRGYGQSRPPDKAFTANFLREDAEDVAELMKALGHSSYSILGWSDGSAIASMIAAKYSSRIRKLVIWGGNSYVSPEELQIYSSIRDISNWSAAMKQPMIDVYGKKTFEGLWHAWVDVFLGMPKDEKGNVDLYTNDLHKIKCETLIIHGEKDPMVPKFQPEYLHKNIKGSRLVCWDDGKHNIHIKYDDRFHSLVEDFLLN